MSVLDKALRWSPFQWLAQSITNSKISVLGFHGVDDPTQFAALMDLVAKRGEPVSIEELAAAINGDHELPPRACLVTFDDGERSLLEYGLPILSEREIPGVAFVVPSLISTSTNFWWSAVLDLASGGGTLPGHEDLDGEGLVRFLKQVPDIERREALVLLEDSAGRPPSPRAQLTTQELGDLEAGGIEVGNHTWSHPCLNRCEPEVVRSEIVSGHRALEEALGKPPRWFAYPNGDWDEVAEQTLRDLGYEAAFVFDHRHTEASADALRISRLRVNSDTSTDRFMAISSGLHPALHRLRGRN